MKFPYYYGMPLFVWRISYLYLIFSNVSIVIFCDILGWKKHYLQHLINNKNNNNNSNNNNSNNNNNNNNSNKSNNNNNSNNKTEAKPEKGHVVRMYDSQMFNCFTQDLEENVTEEEVKEEEEEISVEEESQSFLWNAEMEEAENDDDKDKEYKKIPIITKD